MKLKEKVDRLMNCQQKICSSETKKCEIEKNIGTLSTFQEKIKEFDLRFVKIREGLDKNNEVLL